MVLCRVLRLVSCLSLVGRPVRTRLTSFISLFGGSLVRDSNLLSRILSRVHRHTNGQVHPVLVLLVTQGFNGISRIARRSTINLRLLRATSLIRSSIMSRDNRHHNRTDIGTACGGGMTILINSCVLSATLLGISCSRSRRVMHCLTRLNHVLSGNRVLRLGDVDGSRVSRRVCCRMVGRGATTLFRTYTNVNTVSARTSTVRVRRTGQFNRGLNVVFRVHSSVFSCCSSGRVNGPAKGSVARNGLALPMVCTLGSANSRRVLGLTRGMGTHAISQRRVTRLMTFAGRGKNVRCTSGHV